MELSLYLVFISVDSVHHQSMSMLSVVVTKMYVNSSYYVNKTEMYSIIFTCASGLVLMFPVFQRKYCWEVIPAIVDVYTRFGRLRQSGS